ncbi:MAG: radical SAM protein [Gemmatimonadaceae bacterium]
MRADPETALGSLLEEERRPGDRVERALTVFLAGAECPFTCSFCDLWKWTLDGPTPPGALTAQLARVLGALDGPVPDRLKLYNASNFFSLRAVPAEDLLGIATLAAPFSAVTVESHASVIGPQTVSFARRISGRLEVAIGLETVHPIAASELNKRLDFQRFDWSARFLAENGIDLRVFVLLGAPFVPDTESVAWTLRAVEYAVERGASTVSIIPVRDGNGELERLRATGDFVSPRLSQLEDSLDGCLQFGDAVVTADLWDLERLPSCEHCRPARTERLRRINITGCPESRVSCAVCGGK